MSPASNDSISGSKRFFCLTAPGLASEQPESAGFDLKDKLRLPLFERHFPGAAVEFRQQMQRHFIFPYCSLTRAISKRISHRLRLVV